MVATLLGMTLFADRPEIRVSVSIDGSPADVWPHVTDINMPARYQDEFQEARWLGKGPALGAQFHGTNRRGDREWHTTSTIIEFEPERRFTWAVGDKDVPLATWSFRIAPTDGGSSLEFWRSLGPGESGLTDYIARHPDREAEIVEARQELHRQHMTSVIEGVKRLVEGTGSRA